jgi:phosphatidylglycerol:prolipoprotein diacylglycerol transferase
VLRKHPYKSGWLFSLYLVLSGAWRFVIEKIRVNPSYDLLGLTVTQAEVIAVLLMLLGAMGLYVFWQRRDREAERAQARENREAARGRQREEAAR